MTVRGKDVWDIERVAFLHGVEKEREATRPQPIAAAPRDGTHVIGLDGRGWREMWFKRDQYEGEFWTDHGDTEPAPTHWIPVPKTAR